MSSDCCVAPPHGAMGCLQFVIVVFPDHTYLLIFDVMLWLLSRYNARLPIITHFVIKVRKRAKISNQYNPDLDIMLLLLNRYNAHPPPL